MRGIGELVLGANWDRARSLLKYWSYRIAPPVAGWLHARLHRTRMRHWPEHASTIAAEIDPQSQAVALSAACGGDTEVGRIVDLAYRFSAVAPNQNRSEIIALLERLAERRPAVLCEIGSAEGGTLFLFAQAARPDARLLSIDVRNAPERVERFRSLVRPGQQLTCFDGNSHDLEVVRRFRDWLGSDRLEFLFIDGDHTAEGVERDFEMYGPSVRNGGLVAFHDIVPDFRTRYGVDTGNDAGGVPMYWQHLKSRYPQAVEFVDHRLQDGRGIGLIEV
jgi:cephalosporin hydroxylase